MTRRKATNTDTEHDDPTLSPRQELAGDLLATGASVTAAAEACGVARQTLSQWLNGHPVFRAALNCRRGVVQALWILTLLSLASPAMAAGICDNPTPWPGGPEAVVDLEGLMALEPGLAGDGPNAPELISVTGDVLALGMSTEARAGELSVAEVICVRERPEWLGLAVRNSGRASAGGRLVLTLPDGRLLETPVPAVPAGGQRTFLIRASDSIIDAGVRLESAAGN